MPHFPKPFFKKSRSVWYVEIDRRQHNLGPDQDEAFRRYHRLMGQPREKKVSPEILAGIIDVFLEWVEQNRSPDTYEWYRFRLQRFIERYPDLLSYRPWRLDRNRRSGVRARIFRLEQRSRLPKRRYRDLLVSSGVPEPYRLGCR